MKKTFQQRFAQDYQNGTKRLSDRAICLLFGLPCQARKARPHAPPASTLAHRLAVIWHGRTTGHVGPKGTSAWKSAWKHQARDSSSRAPAGTPSACAPHPASGVRMKQQKLFTLIEPSTNVFREPGCSFLGRAKAHTGKKV